ncbi:MAG: RecX family transcriptional regulator, partial [Clostridia bacterium]|nr:RecX family transcriptional regulator [Clostridia bacterium]
MVQKGENKQDAHQAVAWLDELDILDDSKVAQQVVQKCISKGYGLSRAKQALYEKRVPKEYWEDALADYPDQTEKIIEFIQNR